MSQIEIRAAVEADVPLIHAFIRELAHYEHLVDSCFVTTDDLRTHLFGPRPAAEVLIGEIDGVPLGYALYFRNFSTFAGKPGLYLEDLFVRPVVRRKGLGLALLRRLAQIAIERDCARIEWCVLDWNAPAIAFYESLGARMMSEWRLFRLAGEPMTRFARGEKPA